jgi:hypothetical protein
VPIASRGHAVSGFGQRQPDSTPSGIRNQTPHSSFLKPESSASQPPQAFMNRNQPVRL